MSRVVHGGDRALLSWRFGVGGERGVAKLGEMLTVMQGTRWSKRKRQGGFNDEEFDDVLLGGR
jgi:hypothetical protein